MNIALRYRDRIDPTIILPQVNWREPRNDRRLHTSVGAGIPVGAVQASAARVGNGKEKKH
jgi:hypothetical protein